MGDGSGEFLMAEIQTHGTVTQASPLRVVVDGATVDSSAVALNGATYALNNRVTITVRTPLVPVVLGIEA
jgi:hypothetical protein